MNTTSETPYRLTVVIEYPNAAAAPGIGRQECLGGTIVALQFNDALTELEKTNAALELGQANCEVLYDDLRQQRDELLKVLEDVFAEFLHYRPQGGSYPMLGGRRCDDLENVARAVIAKVKGGAL